MNFGFPLFPEQASTLATEVDALYFFLLSVSAFFSLLIAAFIFLFFVKYRRRDANEVGQPVHGAVMLEVAWSVIPLLITMVMFIWGAKVFFTAMTPPADATEFFGTGKQWMWKFQHPTGQREINTLHVPVGMKIKMTLTSEDVIHSFYVPAFRVKMDVLPGRYTSAWFEATKPGEYHLFCAEYCGAEHSRMGGTIYVLEQKDYETWLAGGGIAQSPVESGEALFEQYACTTCHEREGTGRGPSLYGIAGQPVRLAGGRTVDRDDTYLRESIVFSGAKLVEGYPQLMPTYQGQISEEGILHLIAYIKSLGGGPADEPAPATSTTAASGDSPS